MPSVDTVDKGGDVGIDYYVDDLVASLNQGTRTSVFGLDAASRRTVRTDTDTTTPGVTRQTVSRYSGDDDNPDVVTETDNSVTRNITGFGGLAAIVTNSTTAGAEVTVQLANLHGDIVATVPATATATGDMTVTETIEYGQTRIAPPAGTNQPRYGWLGSQQRDASILGGLVLMGVRLYASTLGRFLSVDPVPGGNANPYVYPNDPISTFDLDGRRCWGPSALCALGSALSSGARALGSVVTHGASAVGNFARDHWRGIAQTLAVGSCLLTVVTAPACVGIGLVVGAATSVDYSRRNGWSFDLRSAAVSAVATVLGGAIGRGGRVLGALTGRSLSRATRLVGGWAYTYAMNGIGGGIVRDWRQGR